MGALPVRSASYERFLTLRRSASNHLVTVLAIGSTLLVLVPLIAILGYLIYKGASSLNLAFFTHVPAATPGDPGGGMANAIAGSAVILALASALGIPVGIGAGVYLAEYARGTWLMY
jgi:phosphate transport system permease protein